MSKISQSGLSQIQITHAFCQWPIIFQTALDDKFNKKCENSSFFVPKSIEDLKRITTKININRLEQPVRIWTDYERFNTSHFWSKSAKQWWINLDELWKFKDAVLVNGYKKLKNYRDPINGCCICVIQQEMKWKFKCLSLFFVASSIFTIVRITLGFYNKQTSSQHSNWALLETILYF